MKNSTMKLMGIKPERDFPDLDKYGTRKAVCCRCHVPMIDREPMSAHGEFVHPSKNKEGKPHSCKNANKTFTTRDEEVEPFLRKGARRRNKRHGIRP